MTKQNILKTIASISFVGTLFSGYLSYRELFIGSCQLSFISCGTNTAPIYGIPACVIGFVMYSVLFIISLIGLKSKI